MWTTQYQKKVEERNKIIKFRFIFGKSGDEGWICLLKNVVIIVLIALISPSPENRKYNNNDIWRGTVIADRTHKQFKSKLSGVETSLCI